jgi:hypothetical protein
MNEAQLSGSGTAGQKSFDFPAVKGIVLAA